MATIPASGTLYLCTTDSTAISQNRSIAHVVYGGSPPATVNLTTVGSCAGMTGNITMQCFYGYSSGINIGFGITPTLTVDSVGGTVFLRCCTGTAVACETSSPTSTWSGSWNVSAGCYYIDLGSVDAYSGRLIVPAQYSWNWFNSGVSGFGPSSSCVNADDTLNVCVSEGLGGI